MLTALAVVLLSILALLAIPITVTFQLSWPRSARNDVRLRWAFGLIRVRIPPPQPETPLLRKEEPARRSRRVKRRGRKPANLIALVRQTRLRRRIGRFVGDLWHAVRKDNVSLRIRIGLDDPADTGQLWAVLGPASAILAGTRETSITIEPDFLDSTIELHGDGGVTIVPLRLVYLIAALLLSPTVWRGIVQMRKRGSP